MTERISLVSYAAAAVISISLLSGCSGTESVTGLGPAEIYAGRYEAEEVGVSDFPKLDSVQLVIRGNSYSIFNYPIPGEDQAVDFCNSGGTVVGFGDGDVTFIPSDTVGANCDRLHIPQGKMRTVYVGDSINIRDTIEVTFIRQRDQGIIDTVTQEWGLMLSLRRR